MILHLRRRLLPLAAAAALSPGTARALGPVGVEAGFVGGGGTSPSYRPTLLGYGAGGRAGVSWSGVYLGLGGMYYAGESLPVGAPSVVDTTHTVLLGGQGGYTFRLGVLRLRPLLDLGVAEITEAGATGAAFYLQPGITLLVPIGPVYVGFDANGLLIPSHARPCLEAGCANPASADVGFTFHGQIGVSL